MRPQLLMTVVGMFIIGTALCCVASGIWFSESIDVVNSLASFNTMSVQAGGVWNAPKTLTTYWDALITVFKWSYPFLDSPWAIFVKIPLWLLSIGAVWGFIEVFATIIQGLVGIVRSFLPGT